MNNDLGITHLTKDLPGTGGRIKERVEDFVVEEVPLYQFSDHGGFTFLLVEKTDLSSLDLVKIIREHLDLEDHEVGVAGWKDKRAITRQWISLPHERTYKDPAKETSFQQASYWSPPGKPFFHSYPPTR